jgi:lysophospholipase L1-like esterase
MVSKPLLVKAALCTLVTWMGAPLLAAFELRDSDRVVFFGDTLVEDQLFSRYVETFVRVRYPALQTCFINSGVSGQGAADGLRRLERDLGSLRPTIVVVCFGLHDPDLQPLDPTRLAAFRKSYEGLLEAIPKLGARMVLITPPRPHGNLRLAEVPDYSEIVGRYAATISELGQARQIPIVDWFSTCGQVPSLLAANAGEDSERPQNILRPPKLAHAIVAAQLLKLWQADPIRVDISIDWATGVASTSSGSIHIRENTPASLTASLQDLPLPWPMPGIHPEKEELTGWPGAELCQFILRIDNPPPQGVNLVWRSKQFPFEAAALRAGVDIGYLQPLRLSREYRELVEQIDSRHRWHHHRMAPRRPQDAELQEAYETYIRAMELYEEGTAKIILRLPKTFETLLQFRARPAEDPSTPAADGSAPR